MSLSPDYSNIAAVPFVAMALQTQEEINASYQRKMNRDYSLYASPANIRNLFDASESHLQDLQSNLQYRIPSNQKTDIE
jgi:hypothetical protein